MTDSKIQKAKREELAEQICQIYGIKISPDDDILAIGAIHEYFLNQQDKRLEELLQQRTGILVDNLKKLENAAWDKKQTEIDTAAQAAVTAAHKEIDAAVKKIGDEINFALHNAKSGKGNTSQSSITSTNPKILGFFGAGLLFAFSLTFGAGYWINAHQTAINAYNLGFHAGEKAVVSDLLTPKKNQK